MRTSFVVLLIVFCCLVVLIYAFITATAILLTVSKMQSQSLDSYLIERNDIINAETELRVGGKVKLSPDEMIFNKSLMSHKSNEIKDARTGNGFLLPSKNFVHIKHLLEKSEVYQMIKRMPKGGMLHLHDLSMTSPLWLIKNATYRQDCYMCINSTTNNTLFSIRNKAPLDTQDCKWKLVIDERSKAQDVDDFDLKLSRTISIIEYSSTDISKQTQYEIWKTFDAAFMSIIGLVFHPDIFSAYFKEGLNELYRDGGTYAELRTLLGPVTDSDGKVYPKEWSVREYIRINEEFVQEHSDFIGVKLIYCSLRAFEDDAIRDSVYEAIQFRKKYPDTVIGYDLVGREDSGRSLKELLKQLLILPQEEKVTLPFYFHAGETNWEDTDIDDNLLDTALLRSTRIGHGFALPKHPVTMAKLKYLDVAVELNPISNQVLLLVSDLRNHPGAILLANDYPCVVGSDDPGMWGSLPMSDDYYATFMALLGARGDLRSLKQLFLNSIKYSGMQPQEKTVALENYEKSWKLYIEKEVSLLKSEYQRK